MAQRRMFSMKIIDTDLFLDMPVSSQLLYFHLSMRADDDGFVSSPKKIMKMVNCSDDDFKILVAKQFIIPFESGICVIRHWKIHNYIQKDRYEKTRYLEEMLQLQEIEKGTYDLDTKCIQDVSSLDTQVRLGKERVVKVSEGKEREEVGKEKKETLKRVIEAYSSSGGELNKTVYDFVEMRKAINKKLTPRGLKTILNKLDKMASDEYTKVKILEQSIERSWQTVYELKEDASQLNQQKEISPEMEAWLNS